MTAEDHAHTGLVLSSCSEEDGMAKLPTVDADATREQIAEAMGHMRATMQATDDPAEYAEIEAALNSLLERWASWRPDPDRGAAEVPQL